MYKRQALALAALASACALALASDSAFCRAWRSAVALAFESSVSLAADAARAASPAVMVRWRAASSDAARFSEGETRVSPPGDEAGAEAGSGATLAAGHTPMQCLLPLLGPAGVDAVVEGHGDVGDDPAEERGGGHGGRG